MATATGEGRSLAADKAIQEELDWFKGVDEPLSALCLSGGGIRSATFCLGVLQSLAQKDMLGRFHYLSTVSGGGYIGSWLSAWRKREGHDAVMQRLKDPRPDVEPKPLRRLRSYTNYLSPTWGLSADFLALVTTSLRNMVLNWCVLLPLIAAVLMLPRLQLAMIHWPELAEWPRAPVHYYLLLLVVGLLMAMTIAFAALDVPDAAPRRDDGHSRTKGLFVACCFIPLLAAAVILSWLIAWDPRRITDFGSGWAFGMHPALVLAIGGGLVHLTGVLCAKAAAWNTPKPLDRQGWKAMLPDIFFMLFSGMAGGLCLYFFASLVPDMQQAFKASHYGDVELYTTLSVPVLLLVFWVGATVYAGATAKTKPEDDREWWARATAWWLGAAALWLVGAVAVIYAPQWLLASPWLQKPNGPQAAGLGAALLGVVSSAIGYWSKNGTKIKQETESFIEATGVRLLDLMSLVFIAALVIGMSIAISCTLRLASPELRGWAWMAQPAVAPIAAKAHVAYSVVLHGTSVHLILIAMAIAVYLGIRFSQRMGVNTFSLHSMYGNRLVRAYLGASNEHRHPHWFTGFDPKDNPRLADLADKPDKRRLFHVVNMALNLVKPAGGRLEWQQRKAASFTMTPLHCGSADLCYVPTKHYGSPDGGLSLGRAMAISGAAASPNMGYHSSPLVAFVMTFFNVRLGWWSPNPNKKKFWPRREPPLGVKAMIDEATANTTDDTPFVYLSDGGHFENLGLYEMVRRRCRRIVVVDASCDPTYTFDDLEDAVRKIRVDFGVPIEFQEPLPTPENARASRRRVAIGRILYQDGPEGRLIYVKPVLTGDEPLDVARYAADNNKPGKAFPHQPTSDQFFDESQFESYRMLGKHTGDSCFHNWDDDWNYVDTAKVDAPPPPLGPIRTIPSIRPDSSVDAPARASSSGLARSLQSAADGVRSMSNTALLATAVAVGGATGVGVAIQKEPPPPAAKKAPAGDLASADGKGPRGPSQPPTATTDPQTLQTLQTELKQITQSLQTIADSSAEQRKTAGELADAMRKVADKATNAASSTTIVTELQSMNKQITAALQQKPVNLTEVENLLKKANTSLNNIDVAMQETPPRRTIRAVSDTGVAR